MADDGLLQMTLFGGMSVGWQLPTAVSTHATGCHLDRLALTGLQGRLVSQQALRHHSGRSGRRCGKASRPPASASGSPTRPTYHRRVLAALGNYPDAPKTPWRRCSHGCDDDAVTTVRPGSGRFTASMLSWLVRQACDEQPVWCQRRRDSRAREVYEAVTVCRWCTCWQCR